MPIADPTPTPHPTAARQALARLAELLPSSHLSDPAELTIAQLAAWKPLIERSTFEDPGRAEEMARLAVAAAQASDQTDLQALAYWTAGNVSFLLDRPLEALVAFGQAEAFYQARGEALQVARMSVGAVSALDKAGRYEEALRCGQTALPILMASAELADQRRVMSLYNGIGISSEHVGRHAEALEAYERKWRWWRDRGGDSARIETARSLINMGVVNARLGQYTEAHEAFTQAYDALSAVPASGHTRYDAARCAMNLAWLETLRRSPPEIIREAFAQARAARAAADPDGNATDLALVDLFEAEWLVETGTVDPTLRSTIAGLHDRFADAGLAFEAARAELLLARLALLGGDLSLAQDSYGTIAAAATGRGDAETAYLAGVGQARAYQAAGDLTQGRRALEAVIEAVEATRGQLLAEEHRAGFLDDKLIGYRELASLCLAQGDVAGTLRAIERAKARTLAELLDAGPRQDAAAEISAEAQALATEEHTLRDRLQALPEAETDARRALERDLAAARRQLAQATTRYGDRGSDAIPTIEAICAQLPTDTLLLVYGALAEQTLLFAFDQDGLRSPPCPVGLPPSQDELRLDLARITAVGRLPRDTAQRWATQQIRSAQVPLASWFDRYLAPVRHLLERHARLLIVPDGLLNSLPFGVLYDVQSGCYLGQSHELLIAPSLTTWTLLAGREAPIAGSPLAVGCSAGGRLRRAVNEAQAVAVHFPGTKLLLEDAATRANFARAVRDASLVHIATHGLHRADAPAFSYLELADGRMEAFDIARLELDAATVVLSACETGVGRLTGNELLGLARAFLHAGARSVLATHWAVDDEATAWLVGDFAGRLATGCSVARALHETQAGWLAMHGETLLAHPHFWGGLMLVGTDANLQNIG